MAERKIILAVAGEMASGKDTATHYLIKRYGARAFSFSDILRDILDRLYLPQTRGNLAGLSIDIRKLFGDDVLAKAIVKDVTREDRDFIVVDGVRRPADIVELKNLPGFSFLYVDASLETRYARLHERRQNEDDATKTFEEFKNDHTRETEATIPRLKSEAKFVINNDGSLEDLHRNVDAVIDELRK